jgi:hypothetical protein
LYVPWGMLELRNFCSGFEGVPSAMRTRIVRRPGVTSIVAGKAVYLIQSKDKEIKRKRKNHDRNYLLNYVGWLYDAL